MGSLARLERCSTHNVRLLETDHSVSSSRPRSRLVERTLRLSVYYRTNDSRWDMIGMHVCTGCANNAPQNRELQIMRIVRHPNIVELKAFYYSNGERVSISTHGQVVLLTDTNYRKMRCISIWSRSTSPRLSTAHPGTSTRWRPPCPTWRWNYTSTSSSALWPTSTLKAFVIAISSHRICFWIQDLESWSCVISVVQRSWSRMSQTFPTSARDITGLQN